ncbi:hypothetical protein [Streptomyces werraensis]|uniref:hypothetical protein n=1 Tax=Streptomyces werraensis TaxID=68284 RepID=UPI0034423712
MSRDKGDGPVRRPRQVKRAVVAPGPLKDLKDLLYEVYLAADAPTLDDIAAAIADDQTLTGAPSRDTVHRCISSADLPPKQADAVAVAAVLARRAAWDSNELEMRVRNLWIQARTARPMGLPIREITDPFALEVHRAIDIGAQEGTSLPLLPAYVERSHDIQISEKMLEAMNGQSQIAVLVGDSSSGKTRACWEAVQKLPGEWRLWHPIEPSRSDAVLENLASVGRQTVIWLNELQHYLLTPPGDLGERTAAALRALMCDKARSPVLILATIWPEHWATLVTVPEQSQVSDPHSQARALLTGNDIHVASRFLESDLELLADAAGIDPRVDYAMRHAEQGQVTQYLAGAPALLERYVNAPGAARAVISAAMDIRRLGHGVAIPYSLIEDSAGGYLTDQQWDHLPDNWLEEALSYATQPIRGARGPLSRIRPRRGEPRPSEPHYRLADYLDQYGRDARGDADLPAVLWDSLLAHADAGSCVRLAEAAVKRRFFRAAVAFCRKAAVGGHTEALSLAAGTLWSCGRQDDAIAWYRAAVAAGEWRAVNEAANLLWKKGERSAALDWLEEASMGAPAPAPLAYAGDLLWRDGDVEAAIEWYQKAATNGDLQAARFLDCVEEEPGRVDESLEVLEGRAHAGDVSALSIAAKILEEEGRTREAVGYYMRAVREGDVGAVECLVRLGFDNLEWLKQYTDYTDVEVHRLEEIWWWSGDAKDTSLALRAAALDPEDWERPDYGLDPGGGYSGVWDANPPVE